MNTYTITVEIFANQEDAEKTLAAFQRYLAKNTQIVRFGETLTNQTESDQKLIACFDKEKEL